MRSALRLLTVACYFLPFCFFLITCDFEDMKMAYNQEEADKNIRELKPMPEEMAAKIHTPEMDSFLVQYDSAIRANAKNGKKRDSVMKARQSHWTDVVLKKAFLPTEQSLSGLGCIFFYKTFFGMALMAVSFLTALILPLTFRRAKKAKMILLSLNTISIAAFISISFLSKVTLLAGPWVLLFLLLAQVVIHIRENRSASVT